MRKEVEKEEKRAKRKRQEREDLAANPMIEENHSKRLISSQDGSHASSTMRRPSAQPVNPAPISNSNTENEVTRIQTRNDIPSYRMYQIMAQPHLQDKIKKKMLVIEPVNHP